MTDKHRLSMQAANFITRNVFCEISVYRAAKGVNLGNFNLLRLANYKCLHRYLNSSLATLEFKGGLPDLMLPYTTFIFLTLITLSQHNSKFRL